MLVLGRKVGERILLGDDIRITVVRISGGGVRLGIEAPPHVTVAREELQFTRAEQESVTRESQELEPTSEPIRS